MRGVCIVGRRDSAGKSKRMNESQIWETVKEVVSEMLGVRRE